MSWTLVEQLSNPIVKWFSRYAETIAIVEFGVLIVGGPVAIWRWLTMRDKFNTLLAQNAP